MYYIYINFIQDADDKSTFFDTMADKQYNSLYFQNVSV